VLRSLPLARRWVTIIEGESLMNDAVGLLLYRFAVAAALTGVFAPRRAILDLLWLAGGGVVFGYGAGRLTVWLMRLLRAPHEVILLSFLAARGRLSAVGSAGRLGCAGGDGMRFRHQRAPA